VTVPIVYVSSSITKTYRLPRQRTVVLKDSSLPAKKGIILSVQSVVHIHIFIVRMESKLFLWDAKVWSKLTKQKTFNFQSSKLATIQQ